MCNHSMLGNEFLHGDTLELVSPPEHVLEFTREVLSQQRVILESNTRLLELLGSTSMILRKKAADGTS